MPTLGTPTVDEQVTPSGQSWDTVHTVAATAEGLVVIAHNTSQNNFEGSFITCILDPAGVNQSLTLLKQQKQGKSNVAIFGLDTPAATGSLTVRTATTASQTILDLGIRVYDVDDLDTTTPFGTAVGAGANSSTPSATVGGTPASDSLVLDAVTARLGNSNTQGADQTELYDSKVSTMLTVASTQSGADGAVMTHTLDATYQWAQVAVEMIHLDATPAAAPDAPTTFAAVVGAPGSGEIDCSWDVSASLKTRIYWRVDDTNPWADVQVDENDSTYSIDGLIPGTTYDVRATHFDPTAGVDLRESAATTIIEVTTEGGVSLAIRHATERGLSRGFERGMR